MIIIGYYMYSCYSKQPIFTKGGGVIFTIKNRKDVGGDVHAMKKDAKTIGIVVIATLLTVLIIVGIVLIIVLTKGEDNIAGEQNVLPATVERDIVTTADTGGRGMVATPENIEQILEDLEKPVEDGYYEARMSIEWTFDTWDAISTDAYVENLTSNTRTVYFDLLLSDTEELIYSSPYIPVGGRLDNFALNTELSAGEYSGIVVYHLVDDDFNEISTVSVSVKLIILG